MKKLKSGLFAVLIMVLLAACGSAAKEYMEKYDLGMRYLTEGNYEEAVLAFTAAIEIDDKLPDAYIGRGDAYVMWAKAVSKVDAEKMELALDDYLQAIGLDEKKTDTYLKAADAYLTLGDKYGAIQLLEYGYQNTQNEDLKRRLEELKVPDELTVLIRQDYETYISKPYESYIDQGYDIYKYNDDGYMVHTESWSCGGTDGIWKQTYQIDWDFDSGKNKWIETAEGLYREKESFEVEHNIGTSANYCLGVIGDVCITTDPYPEGTSEIVYNEEFISDEYSIDWYFAKYFYDVDGNVIRIESYSRDDTLLGICELEYEVISITDK